MTNEDRQLLAMWGRLSPAQREAMRELMIRWIAGGGPDIATADVWIREEVRQRLREEFGGKNAG